MSLILAKRIYPLYTRNYDILKYSLQLNNKQITLELKDKTNGQPISHRMQVMGDEICIESAKIESKNKMWIHVKIPGLIDEYEKPMYLEDMMVIEKGICSCGNRNGQFAKFCSECGSHLAI